MKPVDSLRLLAKCEFYAAMGTSQTVEVTACRNSRSV